MGHMIQYPEDITEVYSYCEARKAGHYVVFFGLQYYLEKYLKKPITQEDAQEFLHYHRQVLGEPLPRVIEQITALANLGYWPVEIKAAPEGSVIETQNVLFTIRNTKPEFYWCVGFLESLLLKIWNPCTVASHSLAFKQLVTKFAKETCDNLDHIGFQVHDFGYRGVSSEETAMISGASHLLNFHGSDTISANYFLDKYYGSKDIVKGLSVPASEHSVMCSYGREGEYKAFDKMMELYPAGIVSIVSDSYDYWKILTDYVPSRKEKIMQRDGKVVFRPDSGTPELIVTGDPNATERAPLKGSLELLWEIFGGTVNNKGYRLLNPHVGLIYGDGMHYQRFETILQNMKDQGFASSNLVVGVGGLLLQNHNRDELGFAIKATRIVRKNGEKMEICKDPATDHKKKSKKGLMALHKNGAGEFYTKDCLSEEDEKQGELELVFKDGKVLKTYTLQEITARVSSKSDAKLIAPAPTR
jgi:nicotinamide phosphoribosyltransferase